jgi:hypothetical protein
LGSRKLTFVTVKNASDNDHRISVRAGP